MGRFVSSLTYCPDGRKSAFVAQTSKSAVPPISESARCAAQCHRRSGLGEMHKLLGRRFTWVPRRLNIWDSQRSPLPENGFQEKPLTNVEEAAVVTIRRNPGHCLGFFLP